MVARDKQGFAQDFLEGGCVSIIIIACLNTPILGIWGHALMEDFDIYNFRF
jgi:hypothetical protein